MLRRVLRQRAVVARMAWADFRARYAGTALGALWAVLQPLTTLAVYVFVFSVGFRSAPISVTNMTGLRIMAFGLSMARDRKKAILTSSPSKREGRRLARRSVKAVLVAFIEVFLLCGRITWP